MESRQGAKVRATKLRSILLELGHDINHASALEVIARQYHCKDWNTCAAALNKRAEILPVPTGWQASGDSRERYHVGIDQSILHADSHPAVIRYKETAPKDGTGFATFMQSFDATEYQGKRVEFTASLMCMDCDGATTLWLRADSTSKQAVAFSNLEDKGIGAVNGPISGNTDWTRRFIVLDIPEEAISISFGFYVRGRGAGYAIGFSLNTVSTDTPVSATPSNDHRKPVNLTLRPGDGDG